MGSRSISHRFTEIETQAHLEAVQYFADQLKQFPANRDHVNRLERDIAKLALAATVASGRPSHGEPIRADDGLFWRKNVGLFDNVFVCHRQAEKGAEFAVIERFPSGANEIWIKGRNVVDVLKAFTHDQRHALQIWTEDIIVQVKEFFSEKYPGHDLTRVMETFLHRLTDAELRNLPQRQNHEVRIQGNP